MSTSLESFLKAGLVHYPEARQSVKVFEQEIHASFERAFKARKDWAPLLDPKFTSGGAGDDKKSQSWIWRFVEGKTATLSRVIIDTGLWWGVPDQPSVILYSRVRDPREYSPFTFAPTAGISSFNDDKSTFLSSKVPEDLHLNDLLRLHLDALLGHLKTVDKRSRK